MKNVRHLLKHKQMSSIIAVGPDMYVLEGLKVMLEKNISALLIIDDGELQGIFTERDYARKIILKGRSSKSSTIGEVMTKTIITVSPDHSIEECMQIMTEKHIRHLPVVADNEVIGMVSIGDVVKSVIEAQKQTIQHLENYING